MARSIDELVGANFAAFNEKDIEAGISLIADGATMVDVPSGEVLRGPEGLATYWHG